MNEPLAPEKPVTRPETWLDEHGDALYRYAFFRLRNEALAEDLVQETLLAGFRAQTSFEGRSSERTWLTGILKNKLIDHLRKLGREQSLEDLASTQDEIDALFNNQGMQSWKIPPCRWENPDNALEQKQFWEVLNQCITALPPRQAEAFALCELDGLDGAEACKVMGIATSNIWVMLHRARLRLRQCLEVRWFETKAGR